MSCHFTYRKHIQKIVRIGFFVVFFLIAVPHKQSLAADCALASSSATATFTLTNSCAFGESVDGVELGISVNNAKLIIPDQKTLTILDRGSNPSTLVVGELTVEDGGSVIIPKTGGSQIIIGRYIWLKDCDNDTYIADTVGIPNKTKPTTDGSCANYIRKDQYFKGVYDCDDTDPAKNVSCVTSTDLTQGSLNRITNTSDPNNPALQDYYQEIGKDNGLVGLWHMNETANGTCAASKDVCDSSGNGFGGAVSGTTIIDGKIGKGRNFASGNSVSIADNDKLSFPNRVMTVAGWIKTTVAGSQAIVAKGNSSNWEYALFTSDVHGGFGHWDATGGAWDYVIGPSSINDGNWHHVAGVADGSFMYLYVDGKLEGSTKLTQTWTNGTSTVTFGKRPYGDFLLVGSLDEVALWNRALAPEEIKLLVSRRPWASYTSSVLNVGSALTSATFSWTWAGVGTREYSSGTLIADGGETLYSSVGLVAQWNLNSTSGTTATNDGGASSCGGTASNCNGTLTNFASNSSQDQAAGTGWTANNKRWGAGALMFDGADDYVAVPQSTAFDFGTSDFAIEMWVYPTSFAGDAKAMLSKSTGNQLGWVLFQWTAGKIAFLHQVGSVWGTYSLSTNNLNVSQWNHIVVTRNGTTVSYYINGVYSGGYTPSGAINGSATTLDIGRWQLATSYTYNGIIDSTRVYSRALSAAEVLSNYNAGNIEMQWRAGSTTTPDSTEYAAGTNWTQWAPVGTSSYESQIDSMDTNEQNSNVFQWSSPTAAYTNQTWYKVNNTAAGTQDTGQTSSDGRLGLGTGTSGDTAHVLYGSVLKDGSTYKMWYAGHNGTNFRIYYATSPDGLTWTKYDNTVPNASNTTGTNGRIPLGTSGGDTTAAIFPSVIKDGSTYKMWYVGTDASNSRVFYATSPDGLTWTKLDNTITNTNCNTGQTCGGNGRLGIGTTGGDTGQIAGVRVIKESDSSYLMVYAGQAIGQTGESNTRIYTATSPDGLTWTKVNNAVEAANDKVGTEGRIPLGTTSSYGDFMYNKEPVIMKDGPVYKMWFTGNDGVGGARIYYATSPDARKWIKYDMSVPTASNTVGTNGRIPWGASGGDSVAAVRPMSVINDNQTYKIWYGGYNGTNYRIFMAYMNPIPLAMSNDTTIKMEGTGSLKATIGQPQVDAKTVGLWHLDETDSGTGSVKDSSGNGNNGTVTGTTVVDGFFGKGRSFNGSSTITIPAAAGSALDIVGVPVTLSAWVYPTALADQDIITRNYAYGMGLGSTGKLVCGWVNLSNFQSTTLLSINTWHYVTCIINNSSSQMYIDGKLETTGTLTAQSSNANNVYIGSYVGNSYYFNGIIDEVSVSKVARTADDIAETYRAGRDHRLSRVISSTDATNKTKLPFWVASDRLGTFSEFTIGESAFANYEPDANTAGLWHLEEQTGTGAYMKDSSGTNHGTPAGTTFIQGKVGKGRYFNGTTSDYISIPAASGFNFGTGNFSVSAWVNFPTEPTTYVNVMSTIDAGNSIGWIMSTDNEGDMGFWMSNASSWSQTTVNVPTGWHYWTVVRSGTTLYFYLDGALRETATGKNSNVTSGGPLKMGYNDDWGSYGIYNIDEARVDNVARTAAEIRQAYEVGLRTHPITIDFRANLVSGALIDSTSDLAFSVDETAYGSSAKASHLFVGDTILVKETVSGTEYIAQGVVTAVNSSTGAVTVSSWNTGSTVPSGGFTVNATVFKWQRELMDLTGIPIGTGTGDSINAKDALTRLTLRITDAYQGANIWLDDLRDGGPYLNTSPQTLTITPAKQYFQLRTLFNSSDIATSSSLSTMTVGTVKPTITPTPTPNAPVLLNSRSGKSCTTLCTEIGRSCTSVGVNVTADSGTYMTNEACTTGVATCSTTISATAAGKCQKNPAPWVKCQCNIVTGRL